MEEGVSKDKGAALQRFLSRNRAKSARREQRDGPASPALRWADADVDRSTPGGSPSPTRGDGRPESAYGAHQLHTVQSMAASNYGKLSDLDEHIRGALESHDTHRDLLAETMARMAKHNDRLKWESQRLQGDVRDKAAKTIQVWWRLYYHRLKEQRKIEKRLKSTWMQSVRRMTLPPAPPERPEFENDDGDARGDGEGDGGKKKGKKDKGKTDEHADDEAERAGADGKKKKKSKSKKGKGSKSGEMGADGANGDEGGEGAEGTNGIGAEGDSGADGKKKRKAKKAKRSSGAEGNEEHVDGGKKKKKGKKRKQAGDGGDGHIEGDEHSSSDSSDSSSSSDSSGSSSSGDSSSGGGSSDSSEPEAERGESKAAKRLPKAAKSKAGDVPAVGLDALSHSVAVASGSGRARAPSRSASARSARSGTSEVLEGDTAGGSLRGTLQAQPSMRRGGAYNPRDAIAAAAAASAAAAARRGGQGTGTRPLGDAGGFEGADAGSPALLPFQADARNIASTLRVVDPLTGAVLSGAAPIAGGASAGGYEQRTRTVSISDLLPAAADSPLSRTRTLSHHETTCGGEHGPATAAGAGGAGGGGSPVRHGGSPIRRVKSFYGTTLPAGVESYLARSPRGQPSSGGVYGPSADGGGDGGSPADAAAAVQLQSGTSRSFGDGSSRRVLQLVGEAGGASGEVRTPLRKAITFHVAGLLPEDAGTEGAGHADGSADSGAAAAVAASEAMAHDTSQLPRSAAAVAGAGSGPGVSAFAPAASLPAVGSLDASAGATSPAAGGAADTFPEPALLVPRPASTSAPQLTFADDDLELPSHSARAGVGAAVGNAAAAAGEQGSSLSPARSRRDSPPRGSSTRTAPCSPQREPSAAALSAAMQLEATAGSLTTTGIAPSAAAANATVGSPYASPFTSYGFGAPSQPGGDVVSVLRVTSLGAKSGLVLPSQSARGNTSPLRRQGQSLHTSLASPLPGTGGSPARSQPGQRAALAAEAAASCTSGALRRGEAVAGGPHLDGEAGLNGQRAETAAPSEQGYGGGGGGGEEQWEAEGKGEGGVDYAKEGGEGALLAEASARSVGAADGDENGRGGAGLHAGGEPSSISLKSQKSTGLLMGQRGTVAVSTAMAGKSWRSGADALRSVFTTAQVDPDVLIQRAMTPPRGVRGVPVASAHHSHQHHSHHNQQHQHQHGLAAAAASELYPRSNLAQHLNQLLHHPTKSLQQKLTGAAHPTHGHTSPPGRGPLQPQHQQPAGGHSYRRSSSPNRGADAPAAVYYGHYASPGAAAGTGATAEADAAVSGPAVEPHYAVVTATAAANAAVADAVAAVALQSCLAVDDVGARGPQHAVAGMGEVQGVAGDGGQLAGAGSAAPPRQQPDHVQAGAAVLLPPGSASTPGTAVSIGDGMALGVMRQPEPTSNGLSFRGLAGGVEAGQDAADLVASAAQRLASVAEAAREPADEFMALQPVGARVQPLLPRLDSGRGLPCTDANAAATAAGASGGGGSRPESAGLSLPALAQGASGAAGGAVSGESSTVSSPVRVSQLQLPGRVQPFPAPQHAEGASGAHPAHAGGTAPLSRHPPGWAAGPTTAEFDSASLSAPPQLLSKAVSYGYGLRQQQQQGGGSPLPGLPAASPSGRSRLTSARLAPLATGVGGSPSASPSPSPSGAAAAAQRQGRPPHRLPAPHHHPDDAAHGLVKRSHTQALSTSAEHEEVDGAAEGGFASAPGSPAAYSAAARSLATPGAHLASPTYWSSAQTHHSHHGTGQHGHQHQAAAAAATSETDSPTQQHQPRRTADLGHSSGMGANADIEAAAALLPPPHILGVTAPKTQAAALARGQGYVVGPHNVMSAVRASMYDDLLGAGGAGAGLGAGSWLTRYAAPVDPALNQPPSPRHHHHPHGYQYTGGHGAADHHFHAQPPQPPCAGAGAAEAGADQSLLLQEDPTSPPMHRRGPPDPGQEPASMQAASPNKPLLLHQLPYPHPHPQGQEQQLPRRSFERSFPPAAMSAWPASPGQPRMPGFSITDDGDGVYGSRSEQQFDWGYGPRQDSYAYEEYEEDEGQAASPQRGAGSRYGGSGSMAGVGGGTGAFGGSGGLPQVPPPPRLMTRLVVKRPAPVLRLPVVAASQAAALQQSLADRYGPISTSGGPGLGLGAPELSTASLPAAAFHTSMTASCDGVLRDRVAPSKIRTYSPGPFMMASGSPPGLPSPVGGAGGAGAGAGGGPGGPLSAEPSRLAASASAALLGMEASGYSTVSSLGLGATGPLPPGAGSKAALKEWRALEKWWAAKGLDGAVVQFNKQAVPHKRSAYL